MYVLAERFLHGKRRSGDAGSHWRWGGRKQRERDAVTLDIDHAHSWFQTSRHDSSLSVLALDSLTRLSIAHERRQTFYLGVPVMTPLDPILFSILHHSVSNKTLRLDLAGVRTMISETLWSETLASSEGQLEQLCTLGNWVLYSSLVHFALPVVPSQGRTFFEIMHRCILHPNVYTQFFIKTGIYAPGEDPSNVAESEIASDAFILLCAMLSMTADGPESFLSWFWSHFEVLFTAASQAYTTYMARGGKFLMAENESCFSERAPGYELKKIRHVGLPDGPHIFKSLALLRILKERLALPIPSCPPLILPATALQRSTSIFVCGRALTLKERLAPPIPSGPPYISLATALQTAPSIFAFGSGPALKERLAPPIPSCPPSISPATALQTSPSVFASVSSLETKHKLRNERMTLPIPPCPPSISSATALQPSLSVFASVSSLEMEYNIRNERTTLPIPSCPRSMLPAIALQPAPSIFASVSTLELEHSLRSQLVSRNQTLKDPNDASRCTKKHIINNPQSRKCPQAVNRPLADIANLPLRAQ
ncbi:hypothetical protein DFH06DRAFT_1414618 [Mycena polygramma]|nr:hypothetical protein DFH06DRAFT_1414618 [Mycena polygramma]